MDRLESRVREGGSFAACVFHGVGGCSSGGGLEDSGEGVVLERVCGAEKVGFSDE